MESSEVMGVGGDALPMLWSDFSGRLRPYSEQSEEYNLPSAELFTALRPHLRNWFAGSVLGFSLTLHNYGLKFRGATPGPREEAALRAFVQRAFRERLALQNVMAFWSPNHDPIVLRPECARYQNGMAGEVLHYRVRLTPEELKGLPPVQRTRYSSGLVRLADPEWNARHPLLAESIRVWRSPSAGEGLAFPDLTGYVAALTQSDSMEVGENAYAFGHRSVVRQHKIGHDIKGGTLAGKPLHFYRADQPYAKAVFNEFKGKTGFWEFFDNFDHSFDIPWCDPKKYDAAKWRTIAERLAYWAGPAGLMMAYRMFTPDMFGAVRSQCEEARRDFRPWLENVIGEGFGIPVKLSWANDCFQTGRLQHEAMKWSVQQGFVSNTTACNAQFGDGAFPDEMANKRHERAEHAEDLMPIFDPNHGTGGAGGKPPLTKPGGRKPREEG